MKQPPEITAAIALLEQNGYAITAPSVEAPPPEVDMDKIVTEARASVERLRKLDEDAEQRCMGTALNDPDLPRFRQESTALGHRLAQAEDDLERAIADRALLKGS